MTKRYFLTVNAGSSSIKFCLFDADSLEQHLSGSIAGIGFEAATLTTVGGSGDTDVRGLVVNDHKQAVQIVHEWIVETVAADAIIAVGHRLVHGGPKYQQSIVIDNEVIAELQRIVPLDPEHLPFQIEIIEHLHREFPAASQIACFDTAFFHDLPVESRLLPLPRRYEAKGVRRYGFHGLSYRYLCQRLDQVAGTDVAYSRVIFAHLGNGASLAAMKNGKPVDTSMGLTPAGGVPMSTRSGDIDPGILTYLARSEHMTPEAIEHMIGFESGLLGISERSSDMKELLDVEHEDRKAKEAIDIFCYQVRKFIGAYAAALGGVDAIVFSGGIGEVSAPIRSRVCAGLEFLGVELDDARNQSSAGYVSVEGSRVKVYVIETNEALMIAQDTQKLVLRNNA